MSSKDTTDSNESSASSRPRRANSSSAKMAMTSSAGKSDTESDYRPAMQSQGKRKGGKSKRNAGGPFGGLLRRVTFPRGGGKGG